MRVNRRTIEAHMKASVLAAFLALLPLLANAQPVDPERGAEILRRRQCTSCHSILGAGGTSAPDLAIRRETRREPTSLAALLWNHGPDMWEEMALSGTEPPELTENEAEELYDYLTSLWRYDPIGVTPFGRVVWRELQCARCHSMSGNASGVGSPVSGWPSAPNSMDWVRQMWNHASLMADEFNAEGDPWPQLTLQSLTDLMAYLQGLDGINPPEPVIGENDLERGESLFRDAYCERCHTIGPAVDGRRDLAPAAHDKTLAEMAVEMWNHAPRMSTSPFVEQVDTPLLERGEMAAVLAYVSAKAATGRGGDENRGSRLFDVKNCSACHSRAGEAPPLTNRQEPLTLIGFVVSVWRHGPDMLDDTRLQGVRWPTLAAQDVTDLLAYLNQ